MPASLAHHPPITPTPPVSVLGTALRTARGWHRPLVLFAAAMAVTAAVALVGLVVDDRTLVGAPIWAKPFKFAVSLALYAVTWAWLLSLQTRARRFASALATISVAAGTVEMMAIVGQTVRGQRSHFNVATPLDMTLWFVMGTTITILWVANLLGTVLLMREDVPDPAMRWAIRAGLVLSLAGMAVAFLMTSPTADQLAHGRPTTVGAHSVGVADGGPGMPLTGWSTTGGDLRIPHFVGLHAVQLLPLFAVLLTVLAGRFAALRDQRARVRLMWTAGVGYAGLLGLLTWQALRGQSLIAPDALTLLAATGLAVAVTVGVVAALRPRTVTR